jgi:hypothetical protein
MKKAWQEPLLEKLDVSLTMAGTGSRNVDWSYIGGKHLVTNDDPAYDDYPAPPAS